MGLERSTSTHLLSHADFSIVGVFFYLLLLEDGLLLQDFDCVELVIGAMACQQDFAKAAFADHLEEVKVAGFG